jgi:hypothetical protein
VRSAASINFECFVINRFKGIEMNDVEMIAKYEQVKERAESVGLTIKHDHLDQFTIADVPKAIGLVCYKNLDELSTFIYGYELGYKSGL